MSISDPLGDMLTRIRNAQRARKTEVVSPASRLRESVLEVLKKEGYIVSFERYNVKAGIDELRIQLKYHEGTSVITEIQRISKPGRRVYASVNDLPRVYNGLGISIISTSAGVMSDHDARKSNVGGEVLCQVF
ncbi:MAG: 30S ribosomal protein S8 [Alphaproteobacteria bacterium]